MRLLVDAQCIQSSSSLRGIGRYALSLVRALAAEAGQHQVEVLLNAGDDPARLLRARTVLESFLHPGQVHVFDADWPWRHARPEVRRPAAEAAYAAAVASLRPDVLLVGSVFEGDVENVLALSRERTGVPSAALLFDLIPAADPGTYLLGPGADDYWRRYAMLAEADLLLSISDYSAGQAARLLGAECPAVRTILGGPYPSGNFPAFEASVDEVPGYEPPARYLLAVGGDHPRKNLDRLVEAWGAVPPELRKGCPLVLACGLHPGTVRRLRRSAAAHGLRPEELVVLGRVSDASLRRLYQGATAFVFPSTEEGLGMPPIEAMAVGTATLLARASSLVELTDDASAFFDPYDVADMARCMARVLDDDGHLANLRRTARREAGRLTWGAAARRAWAAIERLQETAESTPTPAAPNRRAVRRAVLVETATSPAPVLLDWRLLTDPPVPPGVAPDELALSDEQIQLASPAAPGVRAALAAATAVCSDSAELARTVVQAGVLDLPVIGTDDLATAERHDVRRALRERLRPLRLTPAQAQDVVEAACAGSRWGLQRSRPVWLLLSGAWQDEARNAGLRDAASAADADLVVAGPLGQVLAPWCDVVVVEDGALDLQALTSARCRGAVVLLARPVDAPPRVVPDWASDVEVDAAPDERHLWQQLFQTGVAQWGRTTGWPWQERLSS